MLFRSDRHPFAPPPPCGGDGRQRTDRASLLGRKRPLRPRDADRTATLTAQETTVRGTSGKKSVIFSHIFCTSHFFAYLCTAKATPFGACDSGKGPFVYRLGRKIFILERGVRLSYGLLTRRPAGRHETSEGRGSESQNFGKPQGGRRHADLYG